MTSLTYPEETLPELVFTHQNDAQATAMIDLNRSISFGDLAAEITHVAAGLRAVGIAPGDVVGVHLANSIDFAAAFHACIVAGAIVMPIGGVVPEDPRPAYIVDSSNYEELRACPERIEIGSVAVDLDGPCCYPVSSGTTGTPKVVVLTHRNLVANTIQFGAEVPVPCGSVCQSVLPFSHIYGLTALLNVPLYLGATVLAWPFEAERFITAHQKYGVHTTFIAPPLATLLARHPLVDKTDFSALKYMIVGAAALNVADGERAAERTGSRMLQGYGMTEASPVTHLTTASTTPLSSIGHPLPDSEQRIVDPSTITDVAPGEVGELWVAGPQVMAGYYHNPVATDATLVGRWLRTGDLARELPGGEVEIVDRLKDVIKYHGYQVSPIKLEALITSCPGVTDAAVVREIHEDEEIPAAYVVGTATSEQVMAFVAERVPGYEKVRAVHHVDTIPRSAAGKILRRELRS